MSLKVINNIKKKQIRYICKVLVIWFYSLSAWVDMLKTTQPFTKTSNKKEVWAFLNVTVNYSNSLSKLPKM